VTLKMQRASNSNVNYKLENKLISRGSVQFYNGYFGSMHSDTIELPICTIYHNISLITLSCLRYTSRSNIWQMQIVVLANMTQYTNYFEITIVKGILQLQNLFFLPSTRYKNCSNNWLQTLRNAFNSSPCIYIYIYI